MTEGSAHILIVEDDPDVRRALERRFKFDGFSVTIAEVGEDALALLSELSPDIVLLDVMLPGLDGFEIAHRMREKSNVPILMLTAKDALEDKVTGLECGADDYLVKPFEFPELAARLRALLRRSAHRRQEDADGPDRLSFEGLLLNRNTHEASSNGKPLELTLKEFDLLEYFLRHPRQILSKEQILDAVWGFDSGISSNVLEVCIRQLRKKLERDPSLSRRVETVRGIGYSLR